MGARVVNGRGDDMIVRLVENVGKVNGNFVVVSGDSVPILKELRRLTQS